MVSSAPFILVPLWIYILTQACRGEEELPREAVLSWFKERVLEGLGLEEPPPTTAPDTAQPEESRRATRRAPRTSRTSWVNHQTNLNQEIQIILFPSAGEEIQRYFFSILETFCKDLFHVCLSLCAWETNEAKSLSKIEQ